MGRRIAGAVVGLVVAMLVITLAELLGHRLFPPPPGTDMRDPAAMAAIVDRLPFAAKAWVVLGWVAGTFAGGCAGLVVARWRPVAWIVAAGVLLGAVLNMTMIPHPVWMIAAGLLLPLVAAWAAVRVAARGALPRT